MNKLISFVMPSLNEEEAIFNTLNQIPKKQLKDLGYDVEIIIVDGKSTDNTVKLAKEAGAKVISSKRGYGKQYKKGFKAAKGDIIVTGDTDMTYPIDKSLPLIKLLIDQNIDFITTNRFMKMEKDTMRPLHKIGNNILTLFTNLLFGIMISDSQSGMWIFRKKILKKIILTSDGMPLSQEIKIKAFRNFSAAEIPITYHERVGEVKLNSYKDGIKNLLFLFKLRFKN